MNDSLIQLKLKDLGVPGTFKARFYPAIPILGVISCLMLVPTLSPNTLELGALLSLAGLVIYLVYARGSHRRHNEQLNTITNAQDQ